jgi:hypothetical protein
MIFIFDYKQMQKTGFWEDYLSLDRLIIEGKTCPKCWKSLEYKGFSNVDEYRAFGVCNPCEFAKLFWTESVSSAAVKKKIETAVSKVRNRYATGKSVGRRQKK